AATFGSLPALMPSIIDCCQTLLEPLADRVLMYGEETRQLLHRIAAVDFGKTGIGVSRPHVSAGARPSTPSGNARPRPTYRSQCEIGATAPDPPSGIRRAAPACSRPARCR